MAKCNRVLGYRSNVNTGVKLHATKTCMLTRNHDGECCSKDAQNAYGLTFQRWLAAAGRSDSASEYDLRAAWRAGEDPAEYRV